MPYRKAALGAAMATISTLELSPASVAQNSTGLTLSVPAISVIGVTPLADRGIAADKLPRMTHSVTADDLAREGSPSLVRALANEGSGASVSDTLGNAFQPDIYYHGFAASPVLGTPQGLAVYQNGIRINEAFGDTVNWDLVCPISPSIALI